MRLHAGLMLLIMLFWVSSTGYAQKNQLAVSFGRTYVSNQKVPGTNFMGNWVAFGEGLCIEANYSRLVRPGDFASFSLEVPVLLDLDEDLNYGVNVIPESYRAYFVTPAARVTFFHNLPITPWVSLGGGFAHFSASSNLEFGGANSGKTGATSAVLQFGGGADIRVWRSYSVRGEFRDFYSGVPQLNISTGKSRQHNRFVGIGVVWHFGR